jgi:ATP-dependent Clp protease adaptor protein ClpS
MDHEPLQLIVEKDYRERMFLIPVGVKTEVMDEYYAEQASIEDDSDVSSFDMSEVSVDGPDRWAVVLFDDSHHSMDYVIWALLKTLPQLSPAEASLIMLEAHNTGTGVVTVCGLSEAERHRVGLQVLQLRCDIQPGW